MRGLLTVTVLCLASVGTHSASREPFEGYWAHDLRDCRNEDGPSSRTFIDMRDAATGPLFDRYENHCRILGTRRDEGGIMLRLRCHEFWDDFRKRANGRNGKARIAIKSADAIMIDGRPFMRCRR